MSENRPNEELCDDCPLREVGLSEAMLRLAEAGWVDPDDSDDKDKIESLENSDAVFSALEKPHPQRCQELRMLSEENKLPPMPKPHEHRIAFNECPEVHLFGLISSKFPEDS